MFVQMRVDTSVAKALLLPLSSYYDLFFFNEKVSVRME